MACDVSQAQSERNAYTKCLVIAEQQLAELRQKFDGDRQHLSRRLTQLDDEVADPTSSPGLK